MAKANCWEVIRCGREPGGANVRTLGVCPVTNEDRLDGINGGANAGRACWVVPAKHRMGILEETFDGGTRFKLCLRCPFYRSVEADEGPSFARLRDLFESLEAPPRPSGWA